MCALSDEEIGLRKEYFKRIKSQNHLRTKGNRSPYNSIPAPDEDPSVTIHIPRNNSNLLKEFIEAII